jgi:hypothetical protein
MMAMLKTATHPATEFNDYDCPSDELVIGHFEAVLSQEPAWWSSRRQGASQPPAPTVGHNGGPALSGGFDPLSRLTRKQIFWKCVWLSEETTYRKVLLLSVGRYFDEDARNASMSYQQMARECGFSEATAKREAKGAQGTWLIKELGKGRARPQGRENLYHGLCPPELVERLRKARSTKTGVSERYPCDGQKAEQGCHGDTPNGHQGCQPDTPNGNQGCHRETRTHY